MTPKSTNPATAERGGPFGLRMGMTLQELQAITALVEDRPFEFGTSSVAESHPDFKRYTLGITPLHGLCMVSAVTGVIPTNGYGEEVRDAFNQYRAALDKKYGSSEVIDSLQSKMWSKAEHWMMGLRMNDRKLEAGWLEKSAGKLANKIDLVYLQATADALNEGRIRVIYYFDNANDCQKWIQDKNNAKL